MYARVTTTAVQRGKIAGAIAIWREQVLPAARSQPGFVSALVLADRHTHQALSITLWETEAALRASAERGYVRSALAKFTGVFVGPLSQEIFEVVDSPEAPFPAMGGTAASRYAGVVTLELQPGRDRADVAVQIWCETALAQARHVPGFQALLVLLDRERERVLSVGLYATEAAALQIETSGRFQQVVALLHDLFVGQPTRALYEVGLHALAAPAETGQPTRT